MCPNQIKWVMFLSVLFLTYFGLAWCMFTPPEHWLQIFASYFLKVTGPLKARLLQMAC